MFLWLAMASRTDCESVSVPSSPHPTPSACDGSVSLPSDPETEESYEGVFVLPKAECCNKGCIHAFEQSPLKEEVDRWRREKDIMGRDNFNSFLFYIIKEMRQHDSHGWVFLGRATCRKAWKTLVEIGTSRLNRLHKHVKQGHLEPPRDLRKSRANLEGRSRNLAEEFFQWAYEHLAETLAEDSVTKRTQQDMSLPQMHVASNRMNQDGIREWMVGPGATTSITHTLDNVRYLPPQSMVELYEVFSAQMGSGDNCSYPSFLRCYKEEWATALALARYVGAFVCATANTQTHTQTRTQTHADTRRHMHTETQTHGHTDTHRHMHRHADAQTHMQTRKHTVIGSPTGLKAR